MQCLPQTGFLSNLIVIWSVVLVFLVLRANGVKETTNVTPGTPWFFRAASKQSNFHTYRVNCNRYGDKSFDHQKHNISAGIQRIQPYQGHSLAVLKETLISENYNFSKNMQLWSAALFSLQLGSLQLGSLGR